MAYSVCSSLYSWSMLFISSHFLADRSACKSLIFFFKLLFLRLTVLKIVPPQLRSSAYGILSAMLNLSLSIFPIIVSALMSVDKTYTDVETLFVICGAMAFLCALWLHILDQTRYDGALRASSAPAPKIYTLLDTLPGTAPALAPLTASLSPRKDRFSGLDGLGRKYKASDAELDALIHPDSRGTGDGTSAIDLSAIHRKRKESSHEKA
jgi:hypothetical protein